MTTRMFVTMSVTLLMSVGCSSSDPEPNFKSTVNFKSSESMISVEFPGGSGEVANGFTFKTDNCSIGLQEDQLKVNGKDYGKVSKGDRVKVEDSGKVLINDAERKPIDGA